MLHLSRVNQFNLNIFHNQYNFFKITRIKTIHKFEYDRTLHLFVTKCQSRMYYAFYYKKKNRA